MEAKDSKWFETSLGVWFFIITLACIVFFNTKNINPSQPILWISSVFLAFPLVLLGIFAVPSIRMALKGKYQQERGAINDKIKSLRKEQDKIKDIDKLLGLDEKIVDLRRELKDFRDNKFVKCAVWAILLLSLTIFSTFVSFGSYLGIPETPIMTALFFWGTYQIASMIRDLILVLE